MFWRIARGRQKKDGGEVLECVDAICRATYSRILECE
jgi:hypothetical protein